MLADDHPFILEQSTSTRLPYTVKDYAQAEFNNDQALIIHHHIIEYISNANFSASQILSHLASLARSLDNIKKESWPEAIDFLLSTASSRLIPSHKNQNDIYNLINALIIILKSTKLNYPRLNTILGSIENSLNIKIDQENLLIIKDSINSSGYEQLTKKINVEATADLEIIMKKYLQAQISNTLFPFSGIGVNLNQKILFIAIKFATIRLAILCHISSGGDLPEENILIQIIQAISRVYDHITDPKLLLIICQDFGWVSESRLLAVIEELYSPIT
jgi:hypothetical protein